MILRTVMKKFWLFGLSIGLAFGILFAATFTIWDWAENPGGIFRDSTGTNWGFVYDTASSWFLPTFLYAFIAASMLHLVVSKMIMIYKTNLSKGSNNNDT